MKGERRKEKHYIKDYSEGNSETEITEGRKKMETREDGTGEGVQNVDRYTENEMMDGWTN